MQRVTGWVAMAVVCVLAGAAWGAAELSPAMQKEIDKQVEAVKGWAASPTLTRAVEEQNGKGPIAGMDNAKWKGLRRSDEQIKAFQGCEAGKLLKQKLGEAGEIFSEAFLSAARGEKVAFVEKTSSYIHKGQAKFDVPFEHGKPWQGKPEFDESTQTHQVQVSVPVLSGGKAAGVLVVGVNLTRLEKMAKK